MIVLFILTAALVRYDAIGDSDIESQVYNYNYLKEIINSLYLALLRRFSRKMRLVALVLLIIIIDISILWGKRA